MFGRGCLLPEIDTFVDSVATPHHSHGEGQKYLAPIFGLGFGSRRVKTRHLQRILYGGQERKVKMKEY